MSLHVTVVYGPTPRKVLEIPLVLAAGSTVAIALQCSGLLVHCPELCPTLSDRLSTEPTAELVGSGLVVGVWGRAARLNQRLRDQDRVEVYRPLKVDPKVARRQRFVKQGAKTAGLFAKRRAGAAAGY
jgi:putative ubiquitin-RnfH superfamily antitoxin RatB of RatAB toxin-antitoxin module